MDEKVRGVNFAAGVAPCRGDLGVRVGGNSGRDRPGVEEKGELKAASDPGPAPDGEVRTPERGVLGADVRLRGEFEGVLGTRRV